MPLFTVESARLAGIKSAQLRKERASQPKPTPLPTVNPTEQEPNFPAIRLMRVRLQLDRIDALMAECDDTKQLKELADAAHRLQEQERILDNRPLPGSRRPSKEPTSRRPTVSPIEPETPS